MESQHLCNVCNKTFSTKYNLKAHLERNKKCINLRGIEVKSEFVCIACNHISMKRSDFQTHLATCTKYLINLQKEQCDKKDIEINKLEEKIEKQKQEYEAKLLQQKKEYEAKLEKFENAVISVAEASKTPTITYNTNSNNGNINNNQILNLSPEVLEPILREKLTFDIAKQGQKGLASFVLNNMLKGPNGELKYKCKDTARQNFEYINKNGDVEKDVRAKKLSQALVDGGVEKIAGEVSSKEWKDDGEKYERYGEKVTEIVTLSTDDSTFRNTLTALTS